MERNYLYLGTEMKFMNEMEKFQVTYKEAGRNYKT